MNGFLHVRRLVTLGIVLSVLVGCGGENNNGSPSSSPTTPETAGTATLLPSVTTVNATKEDYVSSSTDTTWTLRAASAVHPGDVLLLQDAAVKVLSVDQINGQVVLTVIPAEIEDVFSQLSLQQTFDLTSAEFIPDPTSQIPATFTSNTASSSAALSSVASPISESLEKVVTFPYSAPPFAATLTFKLLGSVNLDYDSSTNTGITGKLDVTGIIDGNVSMSTDEQIRIDLPEIPIGRLRIPVPLSVVDRVLGVIGIRVASIYIPLTLGANATASFGIDARYNGTGQANVVTGYDATNGFTVQSPLYTGALNLAGIPPSSVPTKVVKGTLLAGPYVHARPQLLILNSVASIGADVKVGLYGHGQMTSIPSSPYYCLNLQGMVGGEAFGFFRRIGGTPLQSLPITKNVDVGPRFVLGADDCTSSVQFSASTYTVNQTAGIATITVTRSGDTAAATTVRYATSDGTALAGVDYTAASGILSFNTDDTSKTFTIPILNRLLSQGGTVNLTLSQPSNGMTLGTPNAATLTISKKTVQFSASTYTVNQTAGTATITVTRSGDTSVATTVRYATSDGTALAGLDYMAISGILIFGSGKTDEVFDIPILRNPASQGDRTVNLTLSQPGSDTSLGAPSNAVLTITGASFSFSNCCFYSFHAPNLLQLSVLRGGDRTEVATETASVDYLATGQDAVEGIEYQLPPQPRALIFKPGETQKDIPIQLLATARRPCRNLELTLANPSQGSSIIEDNSKVIITIFDISNSGCGTASPPR